MNDPCCLRDCECSQLADVQIVVHGQMGASPKDLNLTLSGLGLQHFWLTQVSPGASMLKNNS
jgi:hypothetical protein